MTDLVDWSKLNDLPEDMRMRWPCQCIYCGFNYIWVVMSERVILQDDGTFAGDGETAKSKTALPLNTEQKSVMDYGYPVFWRRDRKDMLPEPPPFGFDWTQDISHARHYLNHGEAETAAAEAVLLHPSIIGKLRVIQFRIR